VVFEAIEEIKSFANTKHINLKCKIEEPLQIQGYDNLLKIAIKNIIKNAISFSHENSNVMLRVYKDKKNIIIRIEDNGIGIAKEEQKKIFEKFYRVEKSRNKYLGGSGLGMAIVKNIMNLHNGTIDIISKENIGTTVFLKF
jgi:two-component system heavy metal sensor histidine kinase CusS